MMDAFPFEDIVLPSNTSVWRYMKLAGLLSILQTQTIVFPRITKLREIEPYEGKVCNARRRDGPGPVFFF
jgi:hypothetical protein